MNAFHFCLVVGLVGFLAWAAQYMGQPQEPLMPGIKVPTAFVPVAKPAPSLEGASPSPDSLVPAKPAPTESQGSATQSADATTDSSAASPSEAWN